MLVTCFARVKRVEENSEYAKDDKGKTLWDSKVFFFESTLEIIENERGLSGDISVREKLEFGKFYRIGINTDDSLDVIQNQVVADAKTWP